MKTQLVAACAALALAACSDNGAAVQDEAGNEVGMATENAAESLNAVQPEALTATNGGEYAQMASASDLFEIESARLAAEKSQNAGVRELAAMIETDHQRSTSELESAARAAQPAIALSPALTPEQESDLQALRAAGADAFDRLYLDQQVLAHQKALTMVRAYAENGDVPSLRRHASTVSGPIERHLERAQALAAEIAR